MNASKWIAVSLMAGALFEPARALADELVPLTSSLGHGVNTLGTTPHIALLVLGVVSHHEFNQGQVNN